MNRPEYLVIISGLSGSGKSYVQSTLEDLGFYCCDNLPIELIEPFLEEVVSHEKANRVGIVVDVRTHDFANVFPNFYRDRIRQLVPNVQLIFLEASDEVLARRYSETRRPHPLAHDLPILEAIQREREALAEVKSLSNLVLDTSQFSVHELKAEVMKRFQLSGSGYDVTMLITIITFGFKHSHPYNLDLLFDVRFLPNPHFVPSLRPHTGRDREVRDFLDKSEATHEFLEHTQNLLRFLIPQYVAEGKTYLTIGIGCTGGRHRSVAIAEALKKGLAGLSGVQLRVRHRDIAVD